MDQLKDELHQVSHYFFHIIIFFNVHNKNYMRCTTETEKVRIAQEWNPVEPNAQLGEGQGYL